METPQFPTDRSFDLTRIGPFTEAESSMMIQALFGKIDSQMRTSGSIPKRPFIDLFGTQKSMKTSTTGKIEQIFRRNGFRTYCPPESAEHEDVRAEGFDNPVIYQARHLNVVMDQFLNLSRNRSHHLSIVSRGLIDMLYWYEKGLKKGTYSPIHAQSAKQFIYEFLRQNLVDVFLFFTCSAEVAIRREYEGALTQKRGGKMNELDITEGLEIYETVLRELYETIPGLPIFRIDTSEMTLQEASEQALRFILPTLCIRYDVPNFTFMPYALSLLQRRSEATDRFEEQIKLSGYPVTTGVLIEAGWRFERTSFQKDVYLNPGPKTGKIDPNSEILRIRYDGDTIKFMYKGPRRDRVLSHRRPVSFRIDENEAKRILETYETIATVTKERQHYRKAGTSDDGHFFTLHLDNIAGLGNFTEIRALGTSDNTHTEELLALAESLGFKAGHIKEGNYLSIALAAT